MAISIAQLTTEPALYLNARGGLADTLQQIQKGIEYSQKFGRRLILNTRESGLKCQFSDIFEPISEIGDNIVVATDEKLKALDDITSVFPSEIQGRVSTFQTIRDENYNFLEVQSKQDMGIGWREKINQQLLVVERAGGGSRNWKVFNHFRLRKVVACEIRTRLDQLPNDYVALHIRHSDYKTDYKTFLRRLVPLVTGKTVVVCADNRAVKALASRFLTKFAHVVEITEIPDLAGNPLHETDTGTGSRDAIDALTDLFALACADHIYFTELTRHPDQVIFFRFSGFVKLAMRLNFRKSILSNALSADDRPSAHPETEFTIKQGRQDNLNRLCARTYEWKWNLRAKREVIKAWLY